MRGRRRVLLIEDDRDLVSTLKTVLEEEGCVVVTARSGEEAMAAADALAPSLIFMDLHIEGALRGPELLGALRSRLPAARILLISGERDLADRARELGADGSLEKPFDIEALLRVVAAHPVDEADGPSSHP
jgi:DNA-binding response OmpR family regulator